MERLIAILLEIVDRIPWPSEADHDRIVGVLRELEGALGVSDTVPPAAGPMNAPAAPAPVPDPGPVADTTPPADFVPPASPEVPQTPEAGNAFVADPDPAPGAPA